MPEFAIDLGINQAGLGYGMLLSANAAGAVLGGVLLESDAPAEAVRARGDVQHDRLEQLHARVRAVAELRALAGLLVCAGMANLASQSIAQTLVQLLAPPEKRGRVVGVYNMASSGLRAGSGLSIGLVGGLIGIHWSLGLSAGLLVVIVVALIAYTARAAAAQLAVPQRLQPTG